MYGYRNTYKEDLHEFFPLPSKTVVTRGSQIGVIIKFKTFYLKIYDETYEDAYVVKGFKYNEQTPVFEKTVDRVRFGEFASQFTKEDYLIGFEQQGCDPKCSHNNT